MYYLYLQHYCFPAIVRTDMEITLKPLTCSNSNHFVVNSNYFLLQVPQETTARGQPKGDAKFYLKTFDTTVDTHLQS